MANQYLGSRNRTAIHEAGHIVVAVAEARPFEDVVIERVADQNGAMRNLSYRPGDDEIARIALGGIVAVRLCRSMWHALLFDTARDDLCGAASALAGSSSELIDWNVRHTVRTVLDNWAAVEQLRSELIEHQRISYERAVDVVAKANAPCRPPSPLDEHSGCWTRLIEQIQFRIKYPGGLREALSLPAETA